MKKVQNFQAFAAVQVFFACIVLANELMSISNSVPGGNYPIEHQASWAKVLLFCAVAVTSVLVAWILDARSELARFLPSFRVALLLAILPMLAGIGLSHYLSRIGWCCEHPFAFYFGFPFSFVLGIGRYDPSAIQYADYSIFEVLRTSELTTKWEFLPYEFFLSFLCWMGIVFIFLSFVTWLIKRKELRCQFKERVQPKSS